MVHGLSVAGVEMDRKNLAALAVDDPKAFADLAALAKQQGA
jgi:large subunit ribosomal protein L20